MNTKRIIPVLLLALLVLVGLTARVALATDGSEAVTGRWNAADAGQIRVIVRTAGLRSAEASVVLYDRNGKALAEGAPLNGSITFDGLQVGDYKVMAYADDGAQSLAQEVPVFVRQTTALEMKLAKPAPVKAVKYGGGSACGGAWGEGSMLKVSAGYGVSYVYKQCGKVVGTIGTYCTGCGRSGAWRYTTDCQKSHPIVITIPCPRKNH